MIRNLSQKVPYHCIKKTLGLYDDHTYEHCNSNSIKYIEMNKIDVFIYIFL